MLWLVLQLHLPKISCKIQGYSWHLAEFLSLLHSKPVSAPTMKNSCLHSIQGTPHKVLKVSEFSYHVENGEFHHAKPGNSHWHPPFSCEYFWPDTVPVYVYSSMDYMCVMNNLKLILCGIRISIFQKYSHSFRLILSFLIFKFPFISRINIVSLFSCCKVQRLKREMILILNLILFP